MYSLEYHSTIKRNEILPFVTKWSQLEFIILRETSQSQMDKDIRQSQFQIHNQQIYRQTCKNVLQVNCRMETSMLEGADTFHYISLLLNRRRIPNEAAYFYNAMTHINNRMLHLWLFERGNPCAHGTVSWKKSQKEIRGPLWAWSSREALHPLTQPFVPCISAGAHG